VATVSCMSTLSRTLRRVLSPGERCRCSVADMSACYPPPTYGLQPVQLFTPAAWSIHSESY
jgi:hypothetical protein